MVLDSQSARLFESFVYYCTCHMKHSIVVALYKIKMELLKHTPSPRTMFESQPAPVHRTTCSSYLTYLYLYVKRRKQDWEKNKLTFLLLKHD